MVPFRMVTFLLSLLVVSQQEHAWRTSQHDEAVGGSWLYRWFSNRSPYQKSQSSTWQRSSAIPSDTSNLPDGGLPPASDSDTWYIHKKHRHLARLEIGEAFAMQHRVAVMLVALSLITLVAVTWAMKKIMHWVW